MKYKLFAQTGMYIKKALVPCFYTELSPTFQKMIIKKKVLLMLGLLKYNKTQKF